VSVHDIDFLTPHYYTYTCVERSKLTLINVGISFGSSYICLLVERLCIERAAVQESHQVEIPWRWP